MKALFVALLDTVLFLFWQMYPDRLSQILYFTFCEAFPECLSRFDDDFMDILVDLIFQWISGTVFVCLFLSRPPDVHFSENLLLFLPPHNSKTHKYKYIKKKSVLEILLLKLASCALIW